MVSTKWAMLQCRGGAGQWGTQGQVMLGDLGGWYQ